MFFSDEIKFLLTTIHSTSYVQELKYSLALCLHRFKVIPLLIKMSSVF